MNKAKLIGTLFVMMLVLVSVVFAAEEKHAVITLRIGRGGGWDNKWGDNLLPDYHYTWDEATEEWYRTKHNPARDDTPHNWRYGEVMTFGDFEQGSEYITHNIDGGWNDDGTVQYITAEVDAEGGATWDSLTPTVQAYIPSLFGEQLDDWDNSDKIQANAEVKAAFYRKATSIQQEIEPPTSENRFTVMTVYLESGSYVMDEWGDDLIHKSYYTWDEEEKAWYRTNHEPQDYDTPYNWRHGEKLSGDNWASLEAGTHHIAFGVDGGGDDDGRVKYMTANVDTTGSADWSWWSGKTAELDDVYDAAQTKADADMKSAFHKRVAQVEQELKAEIKEAQKQLEIAKKDDKLSEVLLGTLDLKGKAGTRKLEDGRTLTVDKDGNVLALRNLDEVDAGVELLPGELEQLGLKPGQGGVVTRSDGSVINVDAGGKITARRGKEGFARGGAVTFDIAEAAGTGIAGAAPAELLYYYDTTGNAPFHVPKTDKAKVDEANAGAHEPYAMPITKAQYDALIAAAANKGIPSHEGLTPDKATGKFSIVYTKEEEGITTTVTDVWTTDALETKTIVRSAAGQSITMVRDAEGNIQSVTGPGGEELGKSTDWNINDKGKLTYQQKAVKNYDKDKKVAEMDDGRVISLIEDGTIELSADGQTVTIRIEGQKDQELTASEYKELTGLDPKAGVPEAARASIRNLKEVMVALQDALGREDIGLSDLVGRSIHEEGTAYWTEGVRIDITPDGKTVTSTKADIKPEDGSLNPGSDYEQTKKENGRITEILTGTVSDEGDLGTPKTSSSWNYGAGNAGTARVGGKDLSFEFNPNTGDVVWYEFGGKYYRVEDGTWFNDKEFTSPCTTGCPDKDLTNALRKADDAKAAKEGRDTSVARGVQRFWGFLEAAARGGIGRVFGLFMSEEDLEEWREGVDEALCSTIIAGGTECWQSLICSIWVDNKVGGGQVYAETPSGMLTLAVHVEGERTMVETPGGTEYLYKFTYNVNNPNSGQVGFNIQLSGDRTTNLYSDNILLEEGESHSRLGSSAVVQYSTNYYNKVCVVFTKKIEIVGDEISQVCNSITEGGAAKIAWAVGQPALTVMENQI